MYNNFFELNCLHLLTEHFFVFCVLYRTKNKLSSVPLSVSNLLGGLACNQEDYIGYCFVAPVFVDLVTAVFEPIFSISSV